MGDPDREPVDAPPLHVTAALVATEADADGRQILTPIAADGSTTGVLISSRLVLRFDRFLLPVSSIRQAICLRPVLGEVTTLEQCTQAAVFLEPTYDPVRREVTLRLPAGTTLAKATKYQLTVFTPVDESTAAFRAFDGAPLEARFTAEFTTSDADPPPVVEPFPPPGDLFCRNEPCLAACAASSKVANCQDACPDEDCATACLEECTSACAPPAFDTLIGCAFSPCHRAAPPSTGIELGPAMGLDLSSPESITATAIGRTAHQTQMGEHADEPEPRPLRFGRAMPLIDPKNPGNSYLLYKLLVAPGYASSEAAPAQEEIERLRKSVVVGMPMPAPPGGAPDLAALEALSLWIAQGATTKACF